jgi:hypothetical protein
MTGDDLEGFQGMKATGHWDVADDRGKIEGPEPGMIRETLEFGVLPREAGHFRQPTILESMITVAEL